MTIDKPAIRRHSASRHLHLTTWVRSMIDTGWFTGDSLGMVLTVALAPASARLCQNGG
jgi:hypothetical protein